MTFDHLLSLYNSGAITASEFIPEALSCLTSANVENVMKMFPSEVVDSAKAFVRKYQPDAEVIVIGEAPVPTAEQVKLAGLWLERR